MNINNYNIGVVRNKAIASKTSLTHSLKVEKIVVLMRINCVNMLRTV